MAEAGNISVSVITPERKVLDAVADSVVIPAHDGELGILRDRAALMCELGIGQLRYSKGGRTHRVYIDGGFAQVFENSVTVLTVNAVPVEEITAELIGGAEQAVEQYTGTDPDARADRERAETRLRTLRRLRPAQ